MIRRSAGALVFAVASGLSSFAAAQPAADPAAAEALFQRGRALMEQGDMTGACPLFEESYRLDSAPGTLLNIAACSRSKNKTATAWGQFLEAERAFRRKGDERRADFAASQAKEVEPLLAYVVVHVDSHAQGLVIRRDDTVLGAASFDTKLPMDPGTHVVVAEAPGHKKLELRFEANPKTTTRWVVPELERAPEPIIIPAKDDGPTVSKPILPPDEDVASRRRAHIIAGYSVGGAGLLGLALGGVFVGLTAMRSSDLETLCPNQRCSTPEGKDALDEAGRFANAANGLLIVGAALAATGLVVLLTAPKADASVTIGPGTVRAVF